jgi:hypothetical protein
MKPLFHTLLLAWTLVLAGCSKGRADFEKDIRSPSGGLTARLAEYQPQGTIEGYVTLAISARGKVTAPQITLGHMLGVRAGWLDDHTFAVVYDLLEQRQFGSPVYPTGQVSSAVQIVTCDRRYVDCTSIERKIIPTHSIRVNQFPEGTWPVERNAAS